jgi:hypothetical protein
MLFLQAFFAGTVQLDRVNRSHGATDKKARSGNGRCLPTNLPPKLQRQNCGEAAHHTLQREITELIDLNQTGFLKGRTIAENFIYAAEMLQLCHKRKVPTLVLKLDFAKALDTVGLFGTAYGPASEQF